MLAAGSRGSISLNAGNAFETVKDFHNKNPGWLFGHFNYFHPKQYVNDNNSIGFEDGFFFIPEVVIQQSEHRVTIESYTEDVNDIFRAVNAQSINIEKKPSSGIDIKCTYTKNEYFEIIASLKKHIQYGDCYEINFCQDFFSYNATVDPLYLYHELSNFSPNPFAAFYKLNDKYCMCASPERFLRKTGNKLLSQPIKGTGKRNHLNAAKDQENKNHVRISEKERSENVMIVDLVRNDMSRFCTRGSVLVRELFGIYSFPQVHQMISSVVGTVDVEMHWTDMIQACFPMGSMTGAPKIRVMELINRYERNSRELFSGTIGYITPESDFDFNVIIRSLFYNETKKLISFKAGSAITFNSNAADEYDECMMKAAAIIEILKH